MLGTINVLDLGESPIERAMTPILRNIKNSNERLAEFNYEIVIAYFAGDTPIKTRIFKAILK